MNQRFIHLSTPGRATRRSLRRGIGMLEVMVLIAVMGSLLIAGFMQWRVRSYENTSRAEQVKLTQADAALLAFVTVANRLPCPDVDRDGLEDCGAIAQKGWLPTTTLRLAGADAGVHAGQLRYLVQRSLPTVDLTSAGDNWRPFAYDGSTVDRLATDYAGTPIQTLSDVCSKLATGSAAVFAPGFASVASPVPRLVAYALAHPGLEDDDGDGGLFDGQNTLANATQMEPSDRRSALGLYDDVVFERSMSSVRSALGCDTLNNSIDATALAADAVDAVKNMKDGNIADGITAVAWAGLAAVMSALSVIDTSIGLASDIANAGVDSAACAASLGLAVNTCVAIPIHAGAAALAGLEIGLNISSAVASLIAVGVAGVALGLADADAITTPKACTIPPPNNQIPVLRTEVQKTEAELVTLNNTRAAAVTDKANAVTNRNTKIAELRNVILNSPPNPAGSTSPLDGFVNTLTSSASAYFPQQAAVEVATAQQVNAQESYNNAAANVVRYQNMRDNQAALTVTTRASLTQESLTLAVLKSTPGTSPTVIATQEGKVYNLQLDLQLLTATVPLGQTPTLVLLVTGSIAQRDVTATNVLTAANTSLNNANTVRATTVSNYSGAYTGLLNASAAPYIVTQPSGATSTVVSFVEVRIKLTELFGFSPIDSGASAPHPDSVFAKPEKLQRQIDSLDAQILEMNKLLTTTRDALAKLSAPATVPTECTFALNPARPFKPAEARAIVVNVDRKGGTR